MKHLLKPIIENFSLEKFENIYLVPLTSKTPIHNILYDWPSHTGPFRGSVDFAVNLSTHVLAALDGTVTEVIDQHTMHGPSKEFAP